MIVQKHCFECGTELIEKELEGEGIVPYCPQCEQFRFPMYNVAVAPPRRQTAKAAAGY